MIYCSLHHAVICFQTQCQTTCARSSVCTPCSISCLANLDYRILFYLSRQHTSRTYLYYTAVKLRFLPFPQYWSQPCTGARYKSTMTNMSFHFYGCLRRTIWLQPCYVIPWAYSSVRSRLGQASALMNHLGIRWTPPTMLNESSSSDYIVLTVSTFSAQCSMNNESSSSDYIVPTLSTFLAHYATVLYSYYRIPYRCIPVMT
jgi:hypothetical protein